MEVSVVSDALSSIGYLTQSLGFSNLLLYRSDKVHSFSDTSSDQPSRLPPGYRVSAASPPPTRTLTKPRLRKTRRVKRKIVADDGGEDKGFLCLGMEDSRSGDGYSGGGGGGKGWNFGGYGLMEGDWEGFSDNSISDPAFDFVFEILCWITMSNCLHFAFKKVVRFVSGGFCDRGKVSMRMTPVC